MHGFTFDDLKRWPPALECEPLVDQVPQPGDLKLDRMRALLQYTHRLAGALLVAAGAYLVYYGIYAADPSNDSTSNPIGVVEGWSSSTSAWLENGGGNQRFDGELEPALRPSSGNRVRTDEPG